MKPPRVVKGKKSTQPNPKSMQKNYKLLIAAVKLIKKDLSKNFIVEEGRHDELNPDCPECKARILEGFLSWYEDLTKWSKKF